MNVHPLLQRYPIISDQVESGELSIILNELEKVIKKQVEGEIVELGCYQGTTALFLQRILLQHGRNKDLHVYDSFAGLPDKSVRDYSVAGDQFKKGELYATKSQLIKNFRQARLPLPVIHKNWFRDLKPTDLPDAIGFAFLDGDFYESIRDSLRLIWLKLAPGATVLVDDYQSESLPGTKKAVDEWLAAHPAKLRIEASLAIITLK